MEYKDRLKAAADSAVALRAAEKRHQDLIPELFPVGSLIRFRPKRSDSDSELAEGTVLSVSRFGDTRIRVRNLSTSKEYWIDLYWVEGIAEALFPPNPQPRSG